MTRARKGRGFSIQHPLGELKLPEQIPEPRLHELVNKVRARTASESEIAELAEGHIRLAMYIASQYAATAIHMQDVFVNEAMFGLAIALSRAPDKLYDDNITPYIVRYIRKFVFKALTEDRTVPVPYSTIKDRQKRGLSTPLPKVTSGEARIPSKTTNLYELRDVIEHSIRSQFEREVIELRKLGFKDDEIAAKLQCSRPKVTMAKNTVWKRFEEAMADD